MNKPAALGISVGSVVAAAAVGGRFGPQTPGRAAWYAALRKPSYTPPGPAIGLAWTVLDVLLCFTGYRLLAQSAGGMPGLGVARGVALGGWSLTLAGLAGFPAVFFGRKRLAASTGVAAAMFAASSATTLAASRFDRAAASASLPLVAWTGFALLLSEEFWRRNAHAWTNRSR